jgi:hypothetical protein
MARGTQFLDLQTRVRAESGLAQAVAVGVDALAEIKEVINSTCQTLYMDHDWPHLRTVFERESLSAGQQYYDFPTELDVERVEDAYIWWGGKAHPFERGINFRDYNIWSDADRSGPAYQWDVRWVDNATQFEVWPIPDTNDQEFQFIGLTRLNRLINDSDRCQLDDTLVVTFAAAELIKDEKTSEKKLKKAQGLLAKLKTRTRGALPPMRLGLGHTERNVRDCAVVRVR